MAEENAAGTTPLSALDRLGMSGGLIVFLVGVALIVLVFVWAHDLFSSIERLVDSAAPATGNEGSASAGRTLGQVAAIIGLKAVILLVLGYCGGLLATKGVQMASATRGRKPED